MPPVRTELGEFWGVLVAQLLLRDKIQDNICPFQMALPRGAPWMKTALTGPRSPGPPLLTLPTQAYSPPWRQQR